MASGEGSDLSAGGRLRRGLQTSVVDNSSAFGFSITITASFGTLSRLHGQPGFGEIFGFALAAVAAFTVLQAVASSGFRSRPGTAPREVVMLGTALNVASVGLGVGAATLTGLVLDSSVAWPLGAFLAAFVFVLAEALELTLAGGRSACSGTARRRRSPSSVFRVLDLSGRLPRCARSFPGDRKAIARRSVSRHPTGG